MKRAMFSVLTVVVLVVLTGCLSQHGRRPWSCLQGSCAQAPENCQSCDDPADNCIPCERERCCRLCQRLGCRERCQEQPAAGPATGAVTYPYYTTRGPRDFLAKNPQSIGP